MQSNLKGRTLHRHGNPATRGKRNLGGRPPLPAGEVRSARVVAFLRPDDHATLERIARERGVDLGAAAREILERELARLERRLRRGSK